MSPNYTYFIVASGAVGRFPPLRIVDAYCVLYTRFRLPFAVAREAFDLERFYETMKANQDPWEGLSFDQWLAANPVPERWLQRLEADADNLEREQTAPAAPPVASR